MLRWTAIGLKLTGAALLFLYLLGVFHYPEREKLYRVLAQGEQVPAASPNFSELLEHLGLRAEEVDQVAAVRRLEPTWESPRGDGVYAILETGEKKLVGDISDVRWWSSAHSSLYGWASFVLILAGVGIDILLLRTPASVGEL